MGALGSIERARYTFHHNMVISEQRSRAVTLFSLAIDDESGTLRQHILFL
ncbi:MAG: hypothetical protein M2R46_03366 [Verrucomicrobia subdivision 3 bacterium]|nr:hypothetical protein [Limisphaerales bacterium]